jgi:glycerol-3-phosphate acyltransferase PlsY
MDVFIWALVGYGAGTLPSAWLAAVASGKRMVLAMVRRSVGEEDAHVVLKASGGRAATVAAVLDVVKGFVPVLIAVRFAGPYQIAACAIGALAGHCWPPFLYAYAGRGLAAAAGAFLAFLPVEMVLAGIVRVIGDRLKIGGLSSTIGYVAIPLVAWWRGQPAPYVVAAVAINVLVFIRRLEGISEDIDRGARPGRAVVRRIVLDASTKPPDGIIVPVSEPIFPLDPSPTPEDG